MSVNINMDGDSKKELMENKYVINDLCKIVIEMGFRIKRANLFYIAFSFCLVHC